MVYSISIPEVRDLLASARAILFNLAETRSEFEDELTVADD